MSEQEKKIEPRQTEVSVGIRRVYNIGQFESLEVKVETKDVISFSSVEERLDKTDKLTKLLIKKFDNSRMSIFKGLNEIEKNVNYKNLVKNSVNSSNDLE